MVTEEVIIESEITEENPSLFDDEKVYRTIDGSWCQKGKILGYCWSDLHKGYLTKKLIDGHRCLEKQCFGFQKYPEAPYWIQKEESKKKRLEGRNIKKTIKKQKREYLEKIRELTANDKDFYAVAIEYKDGIFILRCVKFKSIDYKEYIKLFSTNCDNARFYIQEIRTYVSKKLQIIEKLGISKIPAEESDNSQT